jgi:hypothetical protein
LEKSLPGYFLLQGVGAGVLVAFLLFLYALILTRFSPYAPDSIGLPVLLGMLCLTFFAFLGVGLSMILHLPSWLLDLPMNATTRVTILTVLALAFELSVFHIVDPYQTISKALALKMFVGSVLIAYPTGLLCGSNVQKIFGFGTVVVRGPIWKWRTTSKNPFALAAMLPIRVLSVFGLAVLGLVITRLYRVLYQDYEYLGATSFIGLYLISSLYLSYRSPRWWILICFSCLLNFPVAAIARVSFDPRWSAPLSGICLGALVSSSILCVGVRAGLSIVKSSEIPFEDDESSDCTLLPSLCHGQSSLEI